MPGGPPAKARVEQAADRLGVVRPRRDFARLFSEVHPMRCPATLRSEKSFAIDPLTGLCDRGAFDAAIHERAQRQRSAGVPLSIVLLEVDYFKQFTAACGQWAAEECLMSIAEIILATVRRGGHPVARLGTATFAVILTDTDEPAAARVAEELRFQADALVIPHPRSPANQYVTLSVGTATSMPGDEPSAAGLLEVAGEDLADYRRIHRNRASRAHTSLAATI
jgi:diguanylate cyclase (GGDEF)-like protein